MTTKIRLRRKLNKQKQKKEKKENKIEKRDEIADWNLKGRIQNIKRVKHSYKFKKWYRKSLTIIETRGYEK